MTARLIVLRQLSRPAVLMLLALYAAIGLAQGGRANDLLIFIQLLPVIAGFLIFSVVINDIADEAIDRVNLPGGQDRPLVAGTSSRRGLAATGLGAGLVALAASLTVDWPVAVVVVAGMVISAGYSMGPLRLAERGAVASLVLPAGLVAVPYLGGVLAASERVTSGDVALLGGLYVAFIGRILLKDFRDVRGDALLGKRTFLVRHGHVWTCIVSAVCWVLGTAVVLGALAEPQPILVAAYSAAIAAVLVLLRGIARATTRREEALIAATVIIGRGMAIVLLAHLSMTSAEWGSMDRAAVLAAIAVLAAGHAWTVLQRGVVSSLVVPDAFASSADRRGFTVQAEMTNLGFYRFIVTYGAPMSTAGPEFDPYARPASSSNDSPATPPPNSGYAQPDWPDSAAGWPSAEPPKGLAVASLVCGICGILLSWIFLGVPSILAVIFGHIALSRAKQGTGSGRDLAIVGLITGYLIIGIWAMLMLGVAAFMTVA